MFLLSTPFQNFTALWITATLCGILQKFVIFLWNFADIVTISVEFCRNFYDFCGILQKLLLSVFAENCSICNQSRAETKDTAHRAYMQLPFSPKLWHIYSTSMQKVLKFTFQYVLYVLCSLSLYCNFILPLRKKTDQKAIFLAIPKRFLPCLS
jgi:hypothetical protein